MMAGALAGLSPGIITLLSPHTGQFELPYNMKGGSQVNKAEV